MKIIQDHVIFSMSKEHHPIARVVNKEQLTFFTRDCFNNQFQEKQTTLQTLDWDTVNPATGPVYVEGAMPGDVLKISIESICVAEWGTMAAIPDNGVLGDLIKEGALKRIPVKDQVAQFSDRIALPCSPMIGVIGVAPSEGAIPCGEPGSHGGNMDNSKIQAGATLYLPVFQEGALLAMGDVHACMGDGEIMVSGLEIPAEVTVTVEILKGRTLENPMLEDDQSYYTIASHENIEQAIYIAVKDMTERVMEKTGFSLEEAGMLLSASGNLQFCQVVDPKRTVRMELKKSVLPDLLS